MGKEAGADTAKRYVGIRKLRRIINEAIRSETGFSARWPHYSRSLMFLGPVPGAFNVKDFSERLRRGLLAYRLALRASRELVRRGLTVRRIALVYPIIRTEEAWERSVNPVRLAVYVPHILRKGCMTIHGVPVACFNADLEKEIPLDGIQPEDVAKSVQETIGTHHVSQRVGPLVPNVYVHTLVPDFVERRFRPNYRRRPGKSVMELDAIGFNNGILDIVEHKIAPGGNRDWVRDILKKMRKIERVTGMLRFIKPEHTRVHIVITAFGKRGDIATRAYEAAQEAAEHIRRFWPPWETHVYGVAVGKSGHEEVYRERIRGRKL